MKSLGTVLIFLGIIIFTTGELWATDIDGTDFNGYKWWSTSHGDSANDIPVTYHINPNTTDCTGEDTAVENGFNTWENVSTSYMDFTRGTNTTDTDYGTYDGNNIIGWGTSLSSSTIGLCTTWYNSSSMRILDSDIEFNDDYEWNTSGAPTTSEMDVQNIATHEIGHFCGLADNYSYSDLTMYGYADYGEIKKRTLTTADEQCISYVYSTASFGTDDSYEDNDYSQQAATISAGTHSGLYLLNDDWYKISLSVGDDITVSITFSDADGDVDLQLYNPSLSLLDGSYGVGDSEEVSATDVTTAGTYYIMVYGYQCDTNTYSMTITTTAAPPASTTTGTGGSSGGKVCFIATAAYSSHESRVTSDEKSPLPVTRYPLPDHPITILQRFRDEYLLTNAPGRVFVTYYERISPPIARYIENKEPLKAVVRFYLKPIVWGARKILK